MKNKNTTVILSPLYNTIVKLKLHLHSIGQYSYGHLVQKSLSLSTQHPGAGLLTKTMSSLLFFKPIIY